MEKENNLSDKNFSRFWKMTYRFCDNIKIYMDFVYGNKNGKITSKEVDAVKDYIRKGFENIIKNTISDNGNN